jgi:hypothetical protein
MAASALLVVPSAAARSRLVPLKISIIGDGTIRLSDDSQLSCPRSCSRTVRFRASQRLKLIARPAKAWKMDTWAGACRGRGPTCTLRLTHAVRVRVVFIAPGTKKNPIPLGTEAYIDEDGALNHYGWGLRVLSSELRDKKQLVVQLSATAHGGDLFLGQLLTNIFIDAKLGEYLGSYTSCIPPAPSLGSLGVYMGPPLLFGVREGQMITGYMCFVVSPTDAPFVLFTEPPLRDINPPEQPPYRPDSEAVWFSLH